MTDSVRPSARPSRIPGFYDQERVDRARQIATLAELSSEQLAAIDGTGGLTAEQANHMIENVVGLHALPLGVAVNFVVNGRDVLVPMALEEPSVVAGASFMAKLARPSGGFTAHTTEPLMIGQMQVVEVPEPFTARLALLENKARILELANQIDPVLLRLGGGARDIEVRIFEDSPIGPFLVVHLIYDTRDAMGANAVNTACEALAPTVEEITGGRVHLRILSNLADRRLARARCTFKVKDLAFGEFSGERVRDGIIEAWAFAAVDPYRAATHNKGIMNGIDPVVIATGNDWRAIEAGAHAYAARSGRYTSLTTWSRDVDGNLVGTIEMPMAVGIVGGATKVHPSAQAALRIMGVTTASELSEVIVSVGLAQNVAALRALATEGIQRGHMTLHARQVAVSAGAPPELIDAVVGRMVAEKKVRIDRAEEILRELRGER